MTIQMTSRQYIPMRLVDAKRAFNDYIMTMLNYIFKWLKMSINKYGSFRQKKVR